MPAVPVAERLARSSHGSGCRLRHVLGLSGQLDIQPRRVQRGPPTLRCLHRLGSAKRCSWRCSCAAALTAGLTIDVLRLLDEFSAVLLLAIVAVWLHRAS